MTIPLRTPRYQARWAADAADLAACQRLRHRCFFGVPGVDADRFDRLCRHLMVIGPSGDLVACLRILAGPVLHGYSAQFYDLRALAQVDAPMLEMGRFCMTPDVQDADVLRLIWGALTALVDAEGIAFVFGCTSFAGVDPAPHSAVFDLLHARFLGPDTLRPGEKADEVLRFSGGAGAGPVPPLLRSYLAMGGWVGDHAVIDRVMNTLHVFTCLEVAAVPPARARALRALAPQAALS